MKCPKANGFNNGEHNVAVGTGCCAYCNMRFHEPRGWKRARPNRNERRRIQLRYRDGNVCMYCYRPFTEKRLPTIDHIQPKSKGGGDELGNLALACTSCNGRKADQVNVPFGAYAPLAGTA